MIYTYKTLNNLKFKYFSSRTVINMDITPIYSF